METNNRKQLVTQDNGNIETAVMSQKAVTNSLSSNYKNFR